MVRRRLGLEAPWIELLIQIWLLQNGVETPIAQKTENQVGFSLICINQG